MFLSGCDSRAQWSITWSRTALCDILCCARTNASVCDGRREMRSFSLLPNIAQWSWFGCTMGIVAHRIWPAICCNVTGVRQSVSVAEHFGVQCSEHFGESLVTIIRVTRSWSHNHSSNAWLMFYRYNDISLIVRKIIVQRIANNMAQRSRWGRMRSERS